MNTKMDTEVLQTRERRRVLHARDTQRSNNAASRMMMERERKKQADGQRELARKLLEHQREQKAAKEEQNRYDT